MRQPAGEPQNFTGQLLVAHPNMLDPNFRRSVLFISSHEADEGAIGVIINRPLDKQVSELLAEPAPGALADVPVFLGGPVATNQLMFAVFDWAGCDSPQPQSKYWFRRSASTREAGSQRGAGFCWLCGLDGGPA